LAKAIFLKSSLHC